MPKFTSEDLLKAMGLKVGQTVCVDNSMNFFITERNDVVFENLRSHSMISIEKFIEYAINYDYTIIQPKPTLTEDEKVILRNLPLDCGYWITRDSDNNLIGSEKEPKEYKKGKWNYTNQWFSIIPFEHLFQSIKVGEKYSIEELLKE